MAQFIFLEDRKGAHNGIDATEHKKGDIVDESVLSDYLKNAWIEQGALSEVIDCKNDGDCDNCDKGRANNPKFNEEIEDGEQNEEEAPANVETVIVGGVAFPVETLGEGGEENAEGGEDAGEADEADENPLVTEAKAIIAIVDPSEAEIARLKEIGIALDVENIEKCSNPVTIIKKVQKALDDLAEEGSAE